MSFATYESCHPCLIALLSLMIFDHAKNTLKLIFLDNFQLKYSFQNLKFFNFYMCFRWILTAAHCLIGKTTKTIEVFYFYNLPEQNKMNDWKTFRYGWIRFY